MRILFLAAFLAAPGALVAQQRGLTSIVDRGISWRRSCADKEEPC
jgi:hypothetical protein